MIPWIVDNPVISIAALLELPCANTPLLIVKFKCCGLDPIAAPCDCRKSFTLKTSSLADNVCSVLS